jgi:hypothetical protein
MTSATFLTIIQATVDFQSYTVSQALVVLNDNNNQFLRHLLSAELNAAWNGQDNNAGVAAPGTGFGVGIVYAAGPYYGMTVNAALHSAFLAGTYQDGSCDSFITYAGSDGEYDSLNICEVRVLSCATNPPPGTFFSLGGTMEGAPTVAPGTGVRAGYVNVIVVIS